MSRSRHQQLRAYYTTLRRAWGCPHWWPAQSRFEVIVGAYLTQNTAWTNVERALHKLRSRRLLSVKGIRETPLPVLEESIRSAGYFRQKSQRLKTFVKFLDQRHGGSLARMFAQPTAKLREQLLALNGVGPETADSILLYAGQHPVFVVDAYTRRVLDRHGILPATAPYEEIREICQEALSDVGTDVSSTTSLRPGPDGAARTKNAGTEHSAMPGHEHEGAHLLGTCHPPSRMSMAKRTAVAQVYNEMHGLIVGVGKNYCLKSKPKCDECPLQKFLSGVK